MSLRFCACFWVALFSWTNVSSGSFSKTGDSEGESGIGISLGDTGGMLGGVEEAEITFGESDVDCVPCLPVFASPAARLAFSLSSRESFLPVDGILGTGLALRPR